MGSISLYAQVLELLFTYQAALALLLVVPCFLLWSAIHEYSHWVAAKLLLKAIKPEFKLYPHFYKGRFRWASVRYKPTTNNYTDSGRALVSLAPRLPGLVACALMPTGLLLPDLIQVVWFMVIGSGVVDYMMGLIGRSEYSDLQKAAKLLHMNPWKLRIYSSWPLLFPLVTMVVWVV